jgi:allantoicase
MSEPRRWNAWGGEPGAMAARSATGDSYVTRPRREGGYALNYGGQHVGDYRDEGAARKAADGYETYRTNRKGRNT